MSDIAPPRRRAARRREIRTTLIAWGFALPFTVLFAVFMAWPVAQSLVMSVTDMGIADLRTPFAVDFVGLDNFVALFHDERFLHSLTNTAYFVVVGVPLTIVGALAVATGVNSGITRLRTMFRVGFYIPVVTSIIAVATIWRFMLQPDGILNQLLGEVGITGPAWLQSTSLAMPVIIVMAAWRNMGTVMVIFLAALQGVPRDHLEAAMVDGASTWQRFRHITLPALRPVMLFACVITGVSYLQFFEEPYVMTQGGPLDATLSTTYYTFSQFGFGHYSYASAASYVLFVAILALTVLQFRLLRSED